MKKSRLYFAIGILSITVIGSYFVTQQLLNSGKQNKLSSTNLPSLSEPNDSNRPRGLASIKNNVSYDMTNALVNQLATSEIDKNTVNVKNNRVSEFDRVIFEELQSKYEVQLENGKIKSLLFDKLAEGEPLKFSNGENFLKSHNKLFFVAFDYVKADIQNSTELNKKYNLLDKNQNFVGTAQFEITPKGEWSGLQISVK